MIKLWLDWSRAYITTMDSRTKVENDNEVYCNKDHDYHQHRFAHFKPITSMKVYLHQTPFSTIIKCLRPMSLIKCEVCNLQFISVLNEDDDVKLQQTQNSEPSLKKRERKVSFEETFAAYYNTSQLDALKSTNLVQLWRYICQSCKIFYTFLTLINNDI